MSQRINQDSQGSSEAAADCSTLTQILRWRAAQQTDSPAYTFLLDGEQQEVSYTYGELDRQARKIGALLQQHGAYGERVLLHFHPGLEYIAAFFGCLYAGAVAVPAYPLKLNRSQDRLQQIVADGEVNFALTDERLHARVGPALPQLPALERLRWLVTDEIPEALGAVWVEPELSGQSLAFLQYTSGSTSSPRGVMVSHQNLLHNQRMIKQAFGQSAASVILGWLPLYHDMGLIGTVLQPLYVGARCILMSPVSFLQKPSRWLQAISTYRATTSGGPNFAYDLCVRKVTAEQRATLDLSTWDTAFNGAEPIRFETLESFAETFAPYGFRLESFAPCYGLAEATLLVSANKQAAGLTKHEFAGDALSYQNDAPDRRQSDAIDHDRSEQGAPRKDKLRTLVSSGQPLSGQKTLIVNPESFIECQPGQVGEIWVSGESVAQGYWNREEETERVFRAQLAGAEGAQFLRTGDLGFALGGELFITGRLKDLIIIRGQNHYPQDIELSVEQSHTDVRQGACAAFGVEVAGAERLVVVLEINHHAGVDTASIIESVRQSVAENHEVQAQSVALIKRHTIPKTSSGKIQRHACREAFLAGTLDVIDQWRETAITPPESLPAAHLAPRSHATEDLEEWLQSLVAHKLSLETSAVALDEPITRYGLDSQAAIELMYTVETTLNVRLPLSIILGSPDIKHLAAQTSMHLSSAQTEPSLVSSDAGANEHPLSRQQQTLWFMHLLAPESAAYNIVAAARILSALDVDALQSAFQSLVVRHPSLRTTFADSASGPVQRVHEQSPLQIHLTDASAWSEETLRVHLSEESRRPFDFQKGSLLRVYLFTRSTHQHVLMLVAHHIILDFWSLEVLMQEFGVFYEAAVLKRTPTLQPLQSQYADYVRWQTEMLSSADGERLWAYWRERLSGASPTLELPTDHTRPPAQTFNGATASATFDASLTEELKKLSRAHNATLYMTLLAGFQAFLYRYSGQTDLLVTSPTSGRSHAGLAGVVGYFVNPLVMRAQLSGEQSFINFLAQARRNTLEAFAHQDYPFAQLVDRLQPDRDPSRPALSQVVFVLQKEHLLQEQSFASFSQAHAGARLEVGGLLMESLPVEQRVAQFDLTLTMVETQAGLSASLQYNTDLYEERSITRMLSHFRQLLHSIVSHPTLPISQLSLLSPAEQDNLLQLGSNNFSSFSFASDRCLQHLFEAQVERTPHQVALVYEDHKLSYAELNNRANQLAHHLITLGIAPEHVVGLCLERSPEMLIALLAVLKAGAAYLPLDPQYPHERLRFMIEDAGARLVLTSSQHQPMLDDLTSHALPAIVVDSHTEAFNAAPVHNPATPVVPDNAAYIIYTSGSTGLPKGVVVTHANVSRLLKATEAHFHFSERDVWTLFHSYAFDFSVWEVWGALAHGGQLVVVPYWVSRSPAALIELIEREKVTVLNQTPSAFRQLMWEERQRAGAAIRQGGTEQRAENLQTLPTTSGWQALPLRFVIFGGEALELNSLRPWLDLYGDEQPQLINMYGITETTVHVTYRRVMRADIENSRGSLIGEAVTGWQLYVLGEGMELLPEGVVGEFYVGGGGLARGYAGRAELSAERFVPHPYSEESGARLYRTGDTGRRVAGGDIEYAGRRDGQVKVRGFRIEVGEIEAVLREQPEVKDAIVLLREEGGEKGLAAYVVGSGEGELSGSEVRQRVKERLPEHMVPQWVVMVDEMPLTSNGKIDKRALSERSVAGMGSAGEAESGRELTPVEELLCGIWRDVLGVSEVGVGDDFFELGGHSLLATQLMMRVREGMGVEVGLRALFESPTVEGLAKEVERRLRRGGGERAGRIETANREREIPLSYAQQRLWFLHQLEPESAAYNTPVAVRLKGELNIAALEYALGEVVRRHEVLRTTFPLVNGQPAQVISPPYEVKLPLVDLRELAEQERELSLQELIDANAWQPFNLGTDELLRGRLMRLNENEHVVSLSTHHIISDGWSMGLMVEEIAALYEAFVGGATSSPLAPLPVQYADYAIWQREWLAGEALAEQLSYWRLKLAGAPAATDLPVDYARPEIHSYNGDSHSVMLSAQLSEAMRAFGRRETYTPFMLMLAALKIVLFKWTAQTDIVVGTVIANRNRFETQRLVGCFMNFLALRSEISESSTVTELLEQVKATVLEAYAHQDCPFEKVIEALNPERQANRNPLYNVALLMQNFPRKPVFSDLVEASVIRSENRSSLLDIRLVAEETPAGMELSCEYNTDIFALQTIESFVESFCLILEQLVEQPETSIESLSLSDELAAHVAGDYADRREQLIVVSATFTSEPLEDSLAFWLEQLELPARIEFAPYNQVFQQLLDPASLLSQNAQGVNIILARLEDWQAGSGNSHGTDGTEESLSEEARMQRNVRDFVSALKSRAAQTTPLLVGLCPPAPSTLADAGRALLFERAEASILAELAEESDLYVVTSAELATTYPVANYYDAHRDALGHVPYTPAFFAALGTMMARKIRAIKSPPYKVIVLDCDDTLWIGGCAEDGFAGVEIDEARRAFQEFMVAQHEAGMLLCLCSKNNEEDVFEVFERRAEMVLSTAHLPFWRINWQPKSENIRSLAEELQLGLDSFIFIDNSPIECAEVQLNCPEVMTLQLPQEPEAILNFLKHSWVFDHLKVTAEDRKRTSLYRQNIEREKFRKESLSLEEFLESIDLRVDISEMRPEQYARVSQLTQRTNQFNLTGIKRTEGELRRLSQSDQFACYTVEVSDRFGDYGLVGVIIAEAMPEALRVDTFLLSCRVLGRGVERRMLAKLGSLAQEKSLARVDVAFVPTAKNRPALDFLNSVGAGCAEHRSVETAQPSLFRFPTQYAAALAVRSFAALPAQAEV